MQVHSSHDVEGNASCNLDLGSRSNQIFLVNAFTPKLLDIATSNIASAKSYDREDTWQRLVCVLDLRSKVK